MSLRRGESFSKNQCFFRRPKNDPVQESGDAILAGTNICARICISLFLWGNFVFSVFLREVLGETSPRISSFELNIQLVIKILTSHSTI